jgi:ElaB/YqjD/DUF883 family membrane-anchored ribosome-binding protein
MIVNRPMEQSSNVADVIAQSADQAVKSTQRVANEALDTLSGTLQDVRNQAAPLLTRTTGQASALAMQSMDAIVEGSKQLRLKAGRASDSTVNYIKEEPVKAMLIAAAAGAALMALVSLVGRLRNRG